MGLDALPPGSKEKCHERLMVEQPMREIAVVYKVVKI
jgi:hypothetical protein